MNQKDIATVIGTIILAVILSYFISTKLFITPTNREQQVETATKITSKFTAPPSQYYNAQSIDPTQLIQIGNNSNTTPFGNGSIGSTNTQ